MSTGELEHKHKLLLEYRKRKQACELQAARQGSNADPIINIEIQELEQKIDQLQREISDLEASMMNFSRSLRNRQEQSSKNDQLNSSRSADAVRAIRHPNAAIRPTQKQSITSYNSRFTLIQALGIYPFSPNRIMLVLGVGGLLFVAAAILSLQIAPEKFIVLMIAGGVLWTITGSVSLYQDRYKLKNVDTPLWHKVIAVVLVLIATFLGPWYLLIMLYSLLKGQIGN